MSSSNEAIFNQLVSAIRTLRPLPIPSYVSRIHNKARHNPFTEEMRPFLSEQPRFPPDDRDADSQFMDGVNIRDLLGRFSNANQVRALGNIDGHRDRFNFRSSVHLTNADQNFLKVITSLTSYCYGEHVNQTLRNAGLPDLRGFADRFGFQAHMKERLLDPSFIRIYIRTDLERGDYVFSLLMLYILDYMKYGPAGMPAYNTDYWNRPTYDVIGSWSWIIWESDASHSDSQTDNLLAFFGKASTLVTLPTRPNETPRPQPLFRCIEALYENIASDEWLGKNIKKPAQVTVDYSRAVRMGIARLRDIQDVVNQWSADVMAIKNTWLGTTFSRWQSAVDQGIVDQYEYSANNDRVVVTGQPVFAWLESGYHRERNFSDRNWWQMFMSQPPYNREYYPTGSCFRAGTKITTNRGVTMIENLKEWDRVLTLAKPEQYGEVSNETVMHRIEVELVGFNKEAPFATPAHVFLTTTGFRAVDPQAAMRENPWRKVGYLEVGHVLYRLREGDPLGYETVEIQSIVKASKEMRTVYGITMKSMADLLKTFPPAKRLSLLQNVRELRPLLEKFGAQAISERLSLELDGPYTHFSGPPLGHVKPQISSAEASFPVQPIVTPQSQVSLDKLVRSYQIVPQDSGLALKKHLFPEITLVEGALIVDGSVEPRSNLDCDESTLCWSRRLGLQGEYEHGWLRFDYSALSAAGVIFFSPEADPSDLSSGDVVPVQTASPKARLQTPSEHEHLKSSSPRREPIMPPQANRAGNEEGTWAMIFDFDMTYDRAVWPPDVPRTTAVNPFSGGILEEAVFITSHGVPMPTYRVPVLDRLRDHINRTLKPGEPELDPFYRTTGGMTPENAFRYTIEVNQVSLFPFISSAGESINPFNVSFMDTIGFPEVMPFLFQSFYVEADETMDNVTGAMYEYDPSKRGMKGNSWMLHRERLRSKVSHAMATFAKPGLSKEQDSDLLPSSITRSLSARRQLSVRELENIPNYNEQTVHNTSQNIIQNMMYYHMDQEQLRMFLTQSRPTNLPPELSTGLSGNLRDFFRLKYAPAFISRSISQISRYEDRFTRSEKRKITYWWEGNGETCLSRSPEYTEINNLASRFAIRQLYATTLDAYFNDRVTPPQEWADKLLESQKHVRNMANILRNPIGPGGNNIVNMRCSVMNTLAPNKTHGEDFFTEIVAYGVSQGVEYPYVSSDPDEVNQWLHDSLRDLIIRILNNDPSLSQDIREGLLRDLEEFERENELNQALSAEQRAANILQRSSFLMGEMSRWVTAIGSGLNAAFGGTKGFQWAKTAFGSAAQNTELRGKNKLMGVATLAMATFYVFEAMTSLFGIVQNWEILNEGQRAVVILETMHIITDAIKNVPEAWNRYKGDTSSNVQANMDSVRLDASVSRGIRENPQRFSNLADDVTGQRNSLQTNVSGHLREAGPPRQGGRRETWNQRIDEIPAGLQPSSQKTARKFSMTGQWLNAMNAIIGIGVTVAMAFSLARDWPNLTTAGRIIETLSVIVQGLSVLLDIVSLASITGIITVSATFATAIPIIGAVLAVLGLILTIIGFFVRTHAAQPPPDPVQTFIDNVAKPLIAGWNEAPEPRLTYSASPSRVTAGQYATITIQMRNASTSDVRLTRTQISVYSGTDDHCLFQEDEFKLANTATRLKIEELGGDLFSTGSGTVAVQPTSNTFARLDRTVFSSQTLFELSVFGNMDNPDTPLGDFLLKPGQSVTAAWSGNIHKRGDSTVEVFEVGLQDNTRDSLPVTRI